MTKISIEIDGKEYPCRGTMGALVRFKEETGQEFSTVKLADLSLLATFLWCCTVSACARDKVEFTMPLMEFADSINIDEFNEWALSLRGEDSSDGEADGKKKQ